MDHKHYFDIDDPKAPSMYSRLHKLGISREPGYYVQPQYSTYEGDIYRKVKETIRLLQQRNGRFFRLMKVDYIHRPYNHSAQIHFMIDDPTLEPGYQER